MSEIRPNLFLGARSDTREPKLRANGINHVLSIEWAKPPLPSNVGNKFVYVHDDPDADLLSLMPECVRFIEESIQQSGTVLVHCFMGISRSSTIVAAYLMKNENISFDDALESIRKSRPQARPNFGFRQQLDLFKAMGFTVDKENKQYKGHLLRELGLHFRDFPDIIYEEIDCREDTTLSEVDLTAISTEYEDVLSRCTSIAKQNVERSIMEWLVCLRQFLKKHRKDIAEHLPLDVETRKSINPNSDFSANRLVELRYQKGLGSDSLSSLLLTITDNSALCLDVAVYQTAGYLCYLKEFKYAIVTDSKEFVILEHQEDVKVLQRAKVSDVNTLMKYYTALFLWKKASL